MFPSREALVASRWSRMARFRYRCKSKTWQQIKPTAQLLQIFAVEKKRRKTSSLHGRLFFLHFASCMLFFAQCQCGEGGVSVSSFRCFPPAGCSPSGSEESVGLHQPFIRSLCESVHCMTISSKFAFW
jgi:hypothetical protein